MNFMWAQGLVVLRAYSGLLFHCKPGAWIPFHIPPHPDPSTQAYGPAQCHVEWRMDSLH
ncbi:hypothetical protein AURDEDRAFT_160890 [Auricularia subglabra TFB-10046 SS5]|nr:hypothetical protein AURDEDRAFT_160890 [Auricularia subglabra TFB-10046 SS5]